VFLAVGLGLTAGPPGAGAADTVPPLVTSLQSVSDPVGDVLNSAAAGLFDNGRADITQASLEYAPGWIRMKVQVKNLTDPLKDSAWSDKSDVEWALDTNSDGKPDYTVEFATDKGELYGAVFDATKPDDKSVCDADSASASPQDGYTLVIDPKCVGNPKSIGFAVATFIDTNPKDDKAPMASDRAPDQGFVAVPAPGSGQPVAPAGSPQIYGIPPAPPAGAPGPGGPTGAAAAPPTRMAAGSRASGPRSAAGPAPASAGPSRTAAGASAPGAGGPAPAAAAPGAPGAPAATAAAAPSNLARTGSASQVRALFGLGILLIGAGLLVMTRPTVAVRRVA
jgi:hypothetical protein